MPRTKKNVSVAIDTAQAASSAVQAAATTSEEKKQRKSNVWNVYYKDNHGKFKAMDEHKDKSHIDLTRAIAASYKASKGSEVAATQTSSEQ
jgi:hypothetical protein